MPPPNVRPVTPVVETIPPVIARPKACAAWLRSPQVAPAPTRAVLFLGSTRTVRIGDMSITRPPSLVPNPGALCPPSRMERSSPLSRAKLTPAMTSATCVGAKHSQRALVEHAVVDGARLVVSIVGRGDHAAAHPLAQGLDISPGDRPLKRYPCHRHASFVPPAVTVNNRRGCAFATGDSSVNRDVLDGQ